MIEHYIFDAATGEELTTLSQNGEVAGFRANDRVRYSDKCSPPLRGRLATVVGFDTQRNIWTQPDRESGCYRTRADYATQHLVKA